jgi:hypothetical protein
MHDRCTIRIERQLVRKLLWVHLMELLGNVGQVETRFGSFGDNINFGAR